MQRLLAERGQHRASSIPDLLIAAAAELNHRTILGLDKDLDLIGELTGQPIEGHLVRRIVRPAEESRSTRSDVAVPHAVIQR